MNTTQRLLEFNPARTRCSSISAIGNCSATGCESFLKQLNCHVSTSQHCVNIVTVLRCSKLSTIHSGYHCSSDPVQVQSLKSHGACFARPTHAPPAFGAASWVQELGVCCFSFVPLLSGQLSYVAVNASFTGTTEIYYGVAV